MMRPLMFYLLLAASFTVNAHKPSDSYLMLAAADRQLHGQWHIALRDLDYALGLDADGDGAIRWEEVRGQRDAIYGYAFNRLSIMVGTQTCALQRQELMIDEHSDGHYAVLNFRPDCTVSNQALSIDYRLFFDLDAQHRGLLRMNRLGTVETAIFSPSHHHVAFETKHAGTPWQTIGNFAREGVWHIWIGYDHVLFLLSLLLPAALVRQGGGWTTKPNTRQTFLDVAGVVTAFTLTHSLTLSLTALKYIALPSRWIESAIAASVAIAALNNIFPVCTSRRHWFAFGFGLIHGMGIAGVLLDMGLPAGQRAAALLGFNLGVEGGQLAIVAAVLPLIVRLSRYRYYPSVVMRFGSASIAVIALIWLAERSLDLQIDLL